MRPLLRVSLWVLLGTIAMAAPPGVSGEGPILAAITNPSAKPPIGELWLLSTVDGSKLGTVSLPAAPARDGLAVSDDKVYVSLQDGSVVCLGEKK